MSVSLLTDTEIITNHPIPASSIHVERRVSAAAPVVSDLAFQIGLWFSGLQSFLQIRNYSFAEGKTAKASGRDWTKEFHLTNSTLLLCSKLTLQLVKSIESQKNISAQTDEDESCVNNNDLDEATSLAAHLKNLVSLNEMLLRAAPLNFSEWIAWCNILSEKLKQSEIVQKNIRKAEDEGANFLPQPLLEILQNRAIPLALEADLRVILPRIARILKWLDVIGQMMKKDEPLKPTLLLFARIYEQTQEMTKYVNNHLSRFADEDDPIFGALDGAIYAASIEIRKVYNYELAGLTEIRQTPQIFAKIETAHGLLNDSLQQTLVNFAQIVEPEIEPRKLFPNFQTKLEQSLSLRRELWRVQQMVQKSEHSADTFSIENLHSNLTNFVEGNMRFLMYKDCETVERFIEEILRTQNRQDLVPILHRFGAYIETLFGQVNMRTVLANHPFDYPQN